MPSERFCVIDVETTGLSASSDRIVEIACVLIDDNRVAGEWSSLVNPGIPIPSRATQVHGIDDAMVASAPPIENLLATLATLTRGRIIAAHNARFDLGFLPALPRMGAICTLALARVVAPEAPNHKNQTLRAYFNIERALKRRVAAHRALGDAVVTAHILLECRERCGRSPADWKRALDKARVA